MWQSFHNRVWHDKISNIIMLQPKNGIINANLLNDLQRILSFISTRTKAHMQGDVWRAAPEGMYAIQLKEKKTKRSESLGLNSLWHVTCREKERLEVMGYERPRLVVTAHTKSLIRKGSKWQCEVMPHGHNTRKTRPRGAAMAPHDAQRHSGARKCTDVVCTCKHVQSSEMSGRESQTPVVVKS